MGCKLGMDPRQVENRSDLANQVIVGNSPFKTKRVKQPTLAVIEPPHHRPTPPRIVSERRNHCSRGPSTTFATKSAKTGLMQRSRGRAWLQCGVRSAASARAYRMGENSRPLHRDKGKNLARRRPPAAARLSIMGLCTDNAAY